MPLMPKRVKYRKQQRGSRKGNAHAGTTLAFGEYGLKSLGRAWVKNTELEACRVSMNRSERCPRPAFTHGCDQCLRRPTI